MWSLECVLVGNIVAGTGEKFAKFPNYQVYFGFVSLVVKPELTVSKPIEASYRPRYLTSFYICYANANRKQNTAKIDTCLCRPNS